MSKHYAYSITYGGHQIDHADTLANARELRQYHARLNGFTRASRLGIRQTVSDSETGRVLSVRTV